MLIILMLAPARADAAARIAESGRYICTDGNDLRFDRRGYGPVLILDGREHRLAQRWVWSGFRFTAPGLAVRGRGREGEKTVTLSRSNRPDLLCNAVPAGTSPGVVTGSVTGAVTIPQGARLTITLARPGSTTPIASTIIRPGRTLPLSWWLAYPTNASGAVLSATLRNAQGLLLARSAATPLPTAPPRRHAAATLVLQ